MAEISIRAHEALWKKLVDIQAGVYGPEYTFPSDLSNVERKFLHYSAQKLHLKTKSSGKPPDRALTVYAKTVERAPAEAVSLSDEGSHWLRQYLEKPSLPPAPNRSTSAFTKWQAGKGDMKPQKAPQNAKFFAEWEVLKQSPAYQEMYESRRHLPVCYAEDTILDTLQQHQVVVLSGPTGSGKSTQVPHMILDRETQAKQHCNIVITQPRRVACIALATRLAAETATQLGRLIGYQIRLESRKSAETRMTFCTVGILLRRLVTDHTLEGVTHVIIDEVHERGSLSDFCLILLRDLLVRRPTLKVLLMSATLNAESFSRYFNNAPLIEVQGRSFPVEISYLEDVLREVAYIPRCTMAKNGILQRRDGTLIDSAALTALSTRFPEADVQSINHLAALDGELDHAFVVEVVAWICKTKPPGGILVFCPGWADIAKIMDDLEWHRNLADKKKYRIIPLHGAVTSFDASVFQVPPAGVRKIVVATNVAETSLTIEDIVYVVDTGLLKEKAYDPHTKMSSLVPMNVSRANANQRSGRAGRCQPGVCFRLYSSLFFEHMEEYQVPELLRTPLEELCLQVKLLKLGDPREFLQLALEPPELRSITSAMDSLVLLGAMHPETTDLTELGYQLASLPIDPRLGKLMIYGCLLNCLLPMLNLATLAAHDPFLSPAAAAAAGVPSDRVKAARQELANNSYSDHMALLNAFYGYERALQARQHGSFCVRYCLSEEALRKAVSTRDQYFRLLKENEMIAQNVADCYDPNYNTFSKSSVLVKSLVSGCLYPNVARLQAGDRKGSFVTRDALKTVITSGSVNARLRTLPTTFIVYEVGERNTGGIFLRTTSLATPYSLLLFGGMRMSCLPADDAAVERHGKQQRQQEEEQKKQLREQEREAKEEDEEATAANFDTFLPFDSDDDVEMVSETTTAAPSKTTTPATAAAPSKTTTLATAPTSTITAPSAAPAALDSGDDAAVEVHVADEKGQPKEPNDLAIVEVDNWVRFSMKVDSSELLNQLQIHLDTFIRNGLLSPSYARQEGCVQFIRTLAHFLEVECPNPPPPPSKNATTSFTTTTFTRTPAHIPDSRSKASSSSTTTSAPSTAKASAPPSSRTPAPSTSKTSASSSSSTTTASAPSTSTTPAPSENKKEKKKEKKKTPAPSTTVAPAPAPLVALASATSAPAAATAPASAPAPSADATIVSAKRKASKNKDKKQKREKQGGDKE